jgi:hypothetical protein
MARKRDPKTGRFLPGHAGGPGRPPRAIETDYLQNLADQVTLEDWAAITRRAVMDAKKGSAAARAWLSKYVLGDRALAEGAEWPDVDLSNPTGALALLGIAAQRVLAGGDVVRARALTDLAGRALQAFELVELAERLTALESRIEELRNNEQQAQS